jgi:hypothetical protein
MYASPVRSALINPVCWSSFAISMVLVTERAAQEGQKPRNLGPATETRTV